MKANQFKLTLTIDMYLTIMGDDLDLETVLNEMEYAFTPSAEQTEYVRIGHTDMWDYTVNAQRFLSSFKETNA